MIVIATSAVQDVAGSFQLYAGQPAGHEAAVYALREVFSAGDTDGVLEVAPPTRLTA